MDFLRFRSKVDDSKLTEKFGFPLCRNGEFVLAEMGNLLCRFGDFYFTINILIAGVAWLSLRDDPAALLFWEILLFCFYTGKKAINCGFRDSILRDECLW